MSLRATACSAGFLLGRVNVKKLAIVYSTGHVWFGVKIWRWGIGSGKGVIFTAPPPPLYFFLTMAHPLGTNNILSLEFRCCKSQEW